jgi:hypothetical protein
MTRAEQRLPSPLQQRGTVGRLLLLLLLLLLLVRLPPVCCAPLARQDVPLECVLAVQGMTAPNADTRHVSRNEGHEHGLALACKCYLGRINVRCHVIFYVGNIPLYGFWPPKNPPKTT